MQADTNAEARAIDWLIRQRDPLFDDWDCFADWLAEDPGTLARSTMRSRASTMISMPCPPRRSLRS